MLFDARRSNDRSWIFRLGQGMEVKARTSELRGKEARIGMSHVPNRMQTELVKACLGLWAGAP